MYMATIHRFNQWRHRRSRWQHRRRSLDYVEDDAEVRTKLAVIFSSLSEVPGEAAITNRGLPGTKCVSATPATSFRRRESKRMSPVPISY